MEIQRGPNKREIGYSIKSPNRLILAALLGAMEEDGVPDRAMLVIKGERDGSVTVVAEWLEAVNTQTITVESESHVEEPA